MPPLQIGRYQIRAELGRGGMATVYKAFDPRFEREVALKTLPPALMAEDQFQARFAREAKTIAQLEHPAIVPVYDFGEDGGRPFIVMRLMQGGSLAERLAEGPLPLPESIKIVERLADALDIAHGLGVIHRDLKPGNILFDQYRNAFLSDFGIARVTRASATLTGSQVLGTPAYMSPEQVQGDKTLDRRSDIYGLGVILFQLLSGELPYQADTPAKVMMMHLLEPVPDLQVLRPEIPDALNQIVQKALAKEPDERFARAPLMAQALARAATESATVATIKTAGTRNPGGSRATTPVEPDAALIRRAAILDKIRVPRWLMGAILVAVLLGAFGLAGTSRAGLWSWRATGSPSPESAAASRTGLPTETAAASQATREPSPSPLLKASPAAPQAALARPPASATRQPAPSETAALAATPTQEPSPSPSQAAPTVGGADRIAFLHENDIWLARLDGSELQQLTSDGGSKENLQWTPDGQEIVYTAGKCARSVHYETGRLSTLACFEVAEFFEGFALSPDGSQLAISLNRELYVVPFDRDRLSSARFRTDLQSMGTCAAVNPYAEKAVKYVRWSRDGRRLAFVFLGSRAGVRQDQIRIIEISNCESQPLVVDEFPGQRFEMPGFRANPVLQRFGWDGEFLFGLNVFLRNDGFGDLHVYNHDTHKAERMNPMDGLCCYRDLSFSPDGRYIALVFQDIRLGAEARSQIYLIPFGTLGTGIGYEPLALPAEFLTRPRERPQPILRPLVSP